MTLDELDRAIQDLITKAKDDNVTIQEIRFLKNLYQKLWELIPELPSIVNL